MVLYIILLGGFLFANVGSIGCDLEKELDSLQLKNPKNSTKIETEKGYEITLKFELTDYSKGCYNEGLFFNNDFVENLYENNYVKRIHIIGNSVNSCAKNYNEYSNFCLTLKSPGHFIVKLSILKEPTSLSHMFEK